MHSIYSERDPRKLRHAERDREVRRIYHHLLLLANGDVEQALDWLEQLDKRYRFFDEEFTLAAFVERLKREKLVAQNAAGKLVLAPGGAAALRRDALERLLGPLKRGAAGDHRVAGAGGGHERTSETRPYAFGDDVAALDAVASLKNAARRSGLDLMLREDDLEIHETEAQSSCSTIILLDVSHSMTLYGEDRITPAKQVALALVELIRLRYPKDRVSVVTFGDDAEVVPIDRLPALTNGPFHTNTKAGLRLAADLLAKSPAGNRQILMITDGKPSAITLDDGTVFKNPFGLDEVIVNKTLEEAAALRRKNIVVTTFMLTDDPYLVNFVDEFTKSNRGRACYAAADKLSDFVLVDYVRNRRRGK